MITTHRSLLLTSSRDLYDALLKRYAQIYEDIPKDFENKLKMVNDKFIDTLYKKPLKDR